MNYILNDTTPLCVAGDGHLVIERGLHELELKDRSVHRFHYVSARGHRAEWLRAMRLSDSAQYGVFDLRHIEPALSTELRGNLERDIPGVIMFVARRAFSTGPDLVDEIHAHLIAVSAATVTA